MFFFPGLSLSKPIVASCGTGVTACVLALVRFHYFTSNFILEGVTVDNLIIDVLFISYSLLHFFIINYIHILYYIYLSISNSFLLSKKLSISHILYFIFYWGVFRHFIDWEKKIFLYMMVPGQNGEGFQILLSLLVLDNRPILWKSKIPTHACELLYWTSIEE